MVDDQLEPLPEKEGKPGEGPTPGQVVYEAFYRQTGNTPSWNGCPRKEAWEAAAEALLTWSKE
ncbi:MAG: hypothetical protein AAF514_12955 [Verrucomicrobiota bacterium]